MTEINYPYSTEDETMGAIVQSDNNSSSSNSESISSDTECDISIIESCSSDADLSPYAESITSDSESTESDSCELSNQNNFNYLYTGCHITVEEAVANVLDMLIKHNLSKSALKAQLNIFNSILPIGHKMPKTQYKFFKYLESQAPPCKSVKHFFCNKCLIYISQDVNACSSCGEENISFFFEIDIKQQLKRLFEINNIGKKLMNITSHENFITDIIDGSEYRRVNANRNPYDLTLVMYTDGISLVKSTSSHCWPLMFVIAELPPEIRYKTIITAGFWYDKNIKPPMNLFLRPFCQTLLNNEIIEWKDPDSEEINQSRIVAPLFIADAPARAQIQNILNFNGEYGCNICELRTVSLENSDGKKMVRMFPYEENLILRKGEEMINQANIVDQKLKMKHFKGVKGNTIISCLPNIDVATCVIPEFMHSVLLGVVKQFLNVWFTKKGEWQIKKMIKEIDEFLLSIRPLQDFARMPRTLCQYNLFKATELYNWLLYYSLPTLNGIMPEKYLQHWMLLVIAVYNLLGHNIKISTQVQESEELLQLFVKEISSIYSNRELSYNTHQLLHLGLVVRRWGPLWATSAFAFENQNGLIAKSVHGTRNLKIEIINNVKIAQGATIMKNRLNSRKTNLVKLIEVLGKNKKMYANSSQQTLLISKGINLTTSLVYDRANIRNVLFTSTLYKETKSNNYTVQIKCNDSVKYAIINCFIKNNASYFLLIQYLHLSSSNSFIHTNTNTPVKHIMPFKLTNSFNLLEINEIRNIKHVIQVGNYLVKILNTYDTVN